jgi:lysophospholipase L1-like esterase
MMAHPGDVLFVNAPSVPELIEYENERSELWEDKCREDVLLNFQDIRNRDRKQIELSMRDYYRKRGWSHFEATKARQWFPFLPAAPAGSKSFSVDTIHPNDRGYDFWGRHMARAIVDELNARNENTLQ